MDNTIYFPMRIFAYDEKFTFLVAVGFVCVYVVLFVCFCVGLFVWFGLLWLGVFLAAPLMSGTSQWVRKSYLA